MDPIPLSNSTESTISLDSTEYYGTPEEAESDGGSQPTLVRTTTPVIDPGLETSFEDTPLSLRTVSPTPATDEEPEDVLESTIKTLDKTHCDELKENLSSIKGYFEAYGYPEIHSQNRLTLLLDRYLNRCPILKSSIHARASTDLPACIKTLRRWIRRLG